MNDTAKELSEYGIVQAERARTSNTITRNRLNVDDVGRSPADRQAAEQEAENRRRDTERTRLRTEVEKQFFVRDDRYYFKDNNQRLAITDRGNKILSAENDARVAIAMAKLAQSKGWNSIKVKGTSEFQREVWLEASSRGLKVQGYAPTEADKAMLTARNESRLKNHIEPSAAKRKEPSAEKVGALRKKKQREEDYNQLRPEYRTRIEKQRIVEAVASAIIDAKFSHPATKAAVQTEVRRQLDNISAKGRDVPTLHTYDRTAPARAREHDRARTQIERHTERTR